MTKSLLLGVCLLAACADGTTPKPGPQGDMGDMGEMGTMGDKGDPGMSGAAGQACWDLNNNRACDMATEDTNDDNTCDVGDCIGPPGDTGSAGTTGQNAVSVYGTAALSVTPTTTATLVPGLTTTLNVPADSVVVLMSDGGVTTTSTAATGYSMVDVVIEIDGAMPTNGGYKRVIAANTTGLTSVFAPWSMSVTATPAAGSHTFTVVAIGTGGGSTNATVSGDSNSVNQASLSVLIMKK